MNKIMLIGNLGRDPEMNYTPDGTAVAKFSVAVRRVGKSATGERQDEADWFNIVAWRQLAETCSTYLKKGHKVFIEGRLIIRKYTDKNGIERTAIEVMATDLEFLTPKDRQSSASSSDILSGDDSLGDLEDHPF
jgi:single-strand DNA-binding protein